MRVAVIGYKELLTDTIYNGVQELGHQVQSLDPLEILTPHLLADALAHTDVVLLVTTDSFMGLGGAVLDVLDITSTVVDEVLSLGLRLINVGSTLVLGKNNKTSILNGDSIWEINEDWNKRAFNLHLSEREFWRGIAEGMDGYSILVPVLDETQSQNSSSYRIAQSLLDAKVCPKGSTGFVHLETVLDLIDRLIETSGADTKRYLASDQQKTYKKWLSEVANGKTQISRFRSLKSDPQRTHGALV